MLIVKDPTLLSATVSAYSARPVYPASWQDIFMIRNRPETSGHFRVIEPSRIAHVGTASLSAQSTRTSSSIAIC